MNAITHAEMAKHIRARLKASGIKARCMINTSCGTRWIRVVGPTFEARFTDEESREIHLIAKVNGLTGARRSEIDIDLINVTGGTFEFHG